LQIKAFSPEAIAFSTRPDVFSHRGAFFYMKKDKSTGQLAWNDYIETDKLILS
jgi:hypothetical protein